MTEKPEPSIVLPRLIVARLLLDDYSANYAGGNVVDFLPLADAIIAALGCPPGAEEARRVAEALDLYQVLEAAEGDAARCYLKLSIGHPEKVDASPEEIDQAKGAHDVACREVEAAAEALDHALAKYRAAKEAP